MRALTRARLVLRRDETLGSVIHSLADVHGGRRLVEEAGRSPVTYRQAADQVGRWASGIHRRAGAGGRVVISTPDGYESFLLCVAASRAGCIPVPVNPRMRPDEIAHVVADSGADLVIGEVQQVDDAETSTIAVDASPDDVAALFYTSGTTGRPKGAELTHRALVGQVTAGAAWPARLRHDELVCALPVAHVMGFAVLMGAACCGIGVYLMPTFRPLDVLDAIETRRSSIFVGVPTMYRMLLDAGAADRDLTSVRVWASGADAMPGDLALRFKRFGATATLPFVGPVGEAAFVEGYGMVEVGGGVAAKVSPPFMHLGLGDSVGLALPGYHLRVVDTRGAEAGRGDTGELWVRGPGVIRRYHNAPEASAATVTADGWLRTGDLVRRGPMGSVVFVGRRKDVIKTGGYSVYALEVQEVLEGHPDVVEAAVIGLPDEMRGEIPAAVVRLRSGAEVSVSDLERWAEARVADYKVPRRWAVVDGFPRTGTTKVKKAELRSLFT